MNQFICICQNKNLIAPTPPVTKLSLAVQCLVIGSVCGFVCVCGGSVITIARNCVHRSSPNWSVGEGSDHLQLIKFWSSCAPGEGSYRRVKIFGSALNSQRAVFASLFGVFARDYAFTKFK